MPIEIIVAIIGASGVVLAAVINTCFKRKPPKAPKNSPPKPAHNNSINQTGKINTYVSNTKGNVNINTDKTK